MINISFSQDIKKMQAIYNPKNTIMSTLHKLKNDKNCTYYFKNLKNNCLGYDSLGFSEKNQFDRDSAGMLSVLNIFLHSLGSASFIKDKSAAEIAKPCDVLNDHNGLILLETLSHLPLIRLICKKIKYLAFDESPNEKAITMLFEMQENKLFNRGSFVFREFPEANDLLDNPLKHRVAKERFEYFQNIKDSLNSEIEILCNLSTEKSVLGRVVWDSFISKQQLDSTGIKNTLLSLCESIKSDNEEKMSKLNIILESEFSDLLNFDIKVSVSDSSMEIMSDRVISKENISKICKVFVLKSDFEITNIAFQSMILNRYTFSCATEF